MSFWLSDSPVKFFAIESFRRLPFILAFALVSALVIRTTLLLDPNKHVYSHKPGKCRLLHKPDTIEAAYFKDVDKLHYLFASDGFRKLINSSYNAGIYFLQYPKPSPLKQEKPTKKVYGQQQQMPKKDPMFVKAMNNLKFERLSISSNKEFLNNFTPLGIDSYIEGSIAQNKYRLYLYIVNAQSEGSHQVEVFLVKIKEHLLVHQYTIKNPAFTSLSDIVVLNVGRFVVSNMFQWSNRWLQLAEFMLQRESGSLLMYDSKQVVTLKGELQTPNGLFWDSATRRLYVSLTNAETVKIYHIEQDLVVKELTQLNLMSSPDQLYYHKQSGELWLTAHPVTHQLLSNLFSGFQAKSASHVLRIRFQGDLNSWVITEPLAINGTLLSTASAITLIDDYLLIGSRTSNVLSCRMNEPLYA